MTKPAKENPWVLFLNTDTQTSHAFAFNLENALHIFVIAFNEASKALEFLLGEHEIKVIICEDHDDNFKLLKFLLSVDLKIPVILIKHPRQTKSMKDLLPDLIMHGPIGPPGVLEATAKAAESILAGVHQEKTENSKTDFVRIKTQLLVRATPLLSDVYLRLSPAKFVRMFKEGMRFSEEDMNRYIRLKGAEYLYLRRDSCKAFAELLKREVEKALESTAESTVESNIKFTENVHESVMELGKKFGFTKEVQEVVRKSVELTVKQIRKNPKLTQILDYLHGDPTRYISSHSTMVAFIASALAQKMDWTSENTLEKLTLAAFFHDMTMGNQTIARYKHPKEVEKDRLKFQFHEVEAFRNHPFHAAQIVQTFTEIPPDVDIIILQHHERPDGSGFPKGTRAMFISPLASVFIVAHDLVDFCLDRGKDADFTQFLAGAKDIYTAGTFRKVYAELLNDTDFLRAG